MSQWPSWLSVLLLTSISTSVSAQKCLPADEIIRSLPVRDHPPQSRTGERPVVEVTFDPHEVTRIPNSNKLIVVSGSLISKWRDDSLAFAHLHPCDTIVSLAERSSSLWSPSFIFWDNHSKRYASTSADVSDIGEVTLKERVEGLAIDCEWKGDVNVPGTLSCPIQILRESPADPSVDFRWIGPSEKADRPFTVIHHEYDKETGKMRVDVVLEKDPRRHVIMFYLPAVLLMLMSWMSLALGPMAITRAVLVVGAFLGLILHYSHNVQPTVTDSVTSTDIWKTFSLVFVILCLAELVLVTCMASLGRSRRVSRCCGAKGAKGKKGPYDIDPQYEELNDLRQRKTRRTSCCCRYSALILDFISMIALFIFFALFVFCFSTRDRQLAAAVNDFRPRDLLWFLPNVH